MPGLSFYFSTKPIDRDCSERLAVAADSLKLFPEYRVDSLYSDDHIRLYFSGYPEYPKTTLNTSNCFSLFEGKMYDLDDREVSKMLSEIAETGLEADKDTAEFARYLNQHLSMADGDYNIVVIDKRNSNFLILNDSFGKLLLYKYADAQQLAVSREVKFVQNATGISEIDPYGAAEFLMLRHTLGGKTMLKDVRRFRHGSFIRSVGRFDPQSCSYVDWDISENDFGKCRTENAKHLAELFLNATANREKRKSQPVSLIGLSGGMDSRSVLGALHRCKSDFVAVSTISNSKANLHDVGIAGELAKSFGTDFLSWVLRPTPLEDRQKLIECRDGLNGSHMAVAFQLYRETLERFGFGANFYTGDGGARIKTPYRLFKKFASQRDLIDYAFLRVSKSDIDDVAELLGIDKERLLSSMENSVLDCPGENLQDKYNYFVIFDRRMSFLFEGEERTRLFYWTVAPFEAQPVYAYAMCLPDKYKKSFRLAVDFAREIDPRLIEIEYADFRARPDSLMARFNLNLKRFVQNHYAIYDIAKYLRSLGGRGSVSGASIDNETKLIAERSELVDRTLDGNKLREILSRPNLQQSEYDGLFTLINYIGYIEK